MTADFNTYRNANLRDYGSLYYAMRWMTDEDAARAERERSGLLERLAPHITYHANGSKICYRGMSPGCELCMNGLWSCLFINNVCNSGCFFCPNEQNTFTAPESAGIKFRTPGQYTEYCRLFGIEGVSISGGEPLLTPKRTSAFMKESRESLGGKPYMWIYSNGILADDEALKKLRDLRINEIRFNIVSRGYNTDAARRAVKYIPAVTVEIPAIPEDLPKLKSAIRELDEAGVKFLNLHQIRATPYNCRRLIERDYTFIPGPHPSVLESELAALEVMLFAEQEGLNISVNYCSFVYRHRYHARAAASRFSHAAARGFESVTERGFIRRIGTAGDKKVINDIAGVLRRSEADPGRWSVSEGGSELYFHPSILEKFAGAGLPLIIKYTQAVPSEGKSGTGDFTVSLGQGMDVALRRKDLFSAVLEGADKEFFIAGLRKKHDGIFNPSFDGRSAGISEIINELEYFELIPAGLQKYTDD